LPVRNQELMATNIINNAMEHGRKAKTDGKQKLEVNLVFIPLQIFLMKDS
jgi:hypothetical protein